MTGLSLREVIRTETDLGMLVVLPDVAVYSTSHTQVGCIVSRHNPPPLFTLVVSFSSGLLMLGSFGAARHKRWVNTVEFTLGKGILTLILYRAERPSVPPIHSAAKEMHSVGPKWAAVHYDDGILGFHANVLFSLHAGK